LNILRGYGYCNYKLIGLEDWTIKQDEIMENIALSKLAKIRDIATAERLTHDLGGSLASYKKSDSTSFAEIRNQAWRASSSPSPETEGP
jgi:hypothetical protein